MNCRKCGKILIKLDRREEMAEFDEDATEGQMADYFAAEESGDHGAWNIAIVEYECKRCGIVFHVQGEDLESYKDLILNWHDKAGKNEDSFSSFVFEYLAFVAHLKNNLFYDTERDRQAIQWLKQDEKRKTTYLANVDKDARLQKTWEKVIAELNEQPLRNSSHDLDNPEVDKWWNSAGDEPERGHSLPRGTVQSTADWANMVEFWCGVRNNLFHGGKNPNFQRDRFLVEHAYATLKAFMNIELGQFYSKT